MQADVEGLQRKVLQGAVRPLRPAYGDFGIPLEDGATLPFTVTRQWSAPAGRYLERWFLVIPGSGEVVHEGPIRSEAAVHGLQSLTEITDEILDPVPLAPGTYLVVFALGGTKGGELEVEAAEVSEPHA
jgi:hypothetical protein